MRYLSLLISLLAICTSCNSPKYATADRASYEQQFFSEDVRKPEAENRKILLSAYLSVVVAEPDSSMVALMNLAEASGGYLSQASPDEVQFHVPAASLEAVLDRVATLGKVRDRRITAEDVTDAFYDAGIRLDNAEKSRQRYLELLKQAANVEETILVEKELQRLTETIDLLKGQRQRMNQREAYSFVRVRLDRKTKLGPLGYVVRGAYSVVKWLFVRG